MSFRVNTNIEALNAQRNLMMTALAFSKSAEKLSSGLRINRAGDDAAGLSISEKLRAQVRGLNQAVRNAQDGISLIQTAEGALNEVHSILQRMRELAVQAANDTLTTEDRQAIAQELVSLRNELDRIAQQTQFNSQNLLDGSFFSRLFHIGANQNQTITVTISNVNSTAIGGNLSGLVDAFNMTPAQTTAEALITGVDAAVRDISNVRSGLGAVQNRLEHTIANLSVAAENLTAAESRIRDTDMASEMVNFTRLQILQQAGVAVLAQANVNPQVVLNLLR
ncbi:MAG: flagellin FliC [Chloroflexota bacterium]